MIRLAGAADLKSVREIFLEYAAWVGGEICFQSFERELAELPGAYAPPGGGILIDVRDGQLAGCTALRGLTAEAAEMKRLYVRPAFRGSGLGRNLALAIADEARKAGYRVLRLDTLPRMDRAIDLYRALGFREIAPYGSHPPGSLCFELDLLTFGESRVGGLKPTAS